MTIRRKVSCKLCGEKWAARQGTIMQFYQDHEQRHGLIEPSRFEGEPEQEYLDRWFKWRDEHFEDNLTREELSDGV